MDDVLQRGEMISSNGMLTTKQWRKRAIGRSRTSENLFCDRNICIQQAQDRDHWWPVVNTVTNIWLL